MSAGRLLPLALVAVMFSGCASPRTQGEAKSQGDKVSLVILPVVVVSPGKDSGSESDSRSKDDDSPGPPRTILLRNIQDRAP